MGVRIGRYRSDPSVEVVVKEMVYSGSDTKKAVRREVAVMKMLDHPHIMPLFESCSKRGRSFLVMPLIDGGDLFNYIRPAEGLPVPKVRRWFAQVVSAVDYMHSQGFVHLDIKPDNILVCSEGGIILTDFGQSREFIPGKKALRATYGTKTYTPPEAAYRAALQHWIEAPQAFEAANIRSESPSVNPLCEGPELDVWALGCTLYVILTGCFPFPGATQQKLMENVLFRTPKHRPQIPSEAMDLIMRMLEKSPERRASIDEIKNSTWLKDTYTIVKEQVDASKASVGQVPVRPVCGAKLDVPVRRSSLAPIVAVRGERENAECPIGEEVAPRDRSKFSLGAVMKWIRNRF